MPVAGCLVEHINEIAVLEDVFDFSAGQQILDVLGDTCGYAAPFSEPLPNLDAVCCGLFLFQQEVELVYIVPRVLFAVAVDGNTIIPFKDKFDTSLKLYSLMTTKPNEMGKYKEKKEA